jgi:protein tyrosine/serine phosphatase
MERAAAGNPTSSNKQKVKSHPSAYDRVRILRKVSVAAALMLALTGPALTQTESQYADLPNFHQVNPQLYRGAQPKAGGLQTLKGIGIKTIVNLRGEDEHAREEGEETRALGLRYYNVPLPELSSPNDKQVQQVLEIINTVENQPVFVHCRRGEDRTGTIVACYRISHDGWTASEAKAEAEKRGMSWTQVGMKRFIDKFYKQQQKPPTQPSVSFKADCKI